MGCGHCVQGESRRIAPVASPDYAAALDATALATPYELYGLIEATAAPLGAHQLKPVPGRFSGSRPAARPPQLRPQRADTGGGGCGVVDGWAHVPVGRNYDR